MAEKIRLSIQYYEENTCLSFAENATIKPRVKFFKGAGCYSTINKGTADRDRVISIGLGCTFVSDGRQLRKIPCAVLVPNHHARDWPHTW